MNLNDVSFERAFATVEQLPPSTSCEIVFAGRSNVGKSSLINKLFNRKGLAKVSATPGKTATINFYRAGKTLRFVDLPGYGYAKVAKSEQARWPALIEGYFNQERNIALVCALVDIRHKASDLDETFVRFVQEAALPFVLVLTKADKLSKQQQLKHRAELSRQLELANDTPILVVSSAKGTGIDALRRTINNYATE